MYDLKSQDRDYRGVNDEIINMENRYKILADDKVSNISQSILFDGKLCIKQNGVFRSDLTSSREPESTEIWMRLLILESKLMTSSTC